MLSEHVQIIGKNLHPMIRYLILMSKHGPNVPMIERLNTISGLATDLDHKERYRNIKIKKMVHEDVMENHVIPSDMILSDRHRKLALISERFRKNVIMLHDLRKIDDPAIKYHIAISRGIERVIVEHLIKTDTEILENKHFHNLSLKNKIDDIDGERI